MKRKNKTGVEWFFRELENVNGYSAFYTNNYQHIDALYNEAKQMEKKYICLAWDEGKVEGMCLAGDSDYNHLLGFEYYADEYETKED